jgi:hypothetical protein
MHTPPGSLKRLRPFVRGYDQCAAFAFGGSFFCTVHCAWKQDADLAVARGRAVTSICARRYLS